MARKREVEREGIANEIPSRFTSCHRDFAVLNLLRAEKVQIRYFTGEAESLHGGSGDGGLILGEIVV